MTIPAISLAQANRHVLRRQHLLAPCHDPVQATADACGLQAQVPSTPALSLRARVASFTRADYDRLLQDERSLVRTWAMRGTVHVVPSAQLPVYTRIYLDGDGLRGYPRDRMQRALELLAAGPQTRAQLAARAVAELGIPREEAEREWFGPWGGVLRRLAHAALTVHAPVAARKATRATQPAPAATGSEVRLVRTVDWLGALPEFPSREALEDALLAAYLRGYGPATMRDFGHFVGIPGHYVKIIWSRARDLGEVRVEGSRLSHYLPSEDLPALLGTTGAEAAPVRLLPRFDSLLLAHRDKTRFLEEAWRPRVFRPAAVVEATVLVHGRVAGVWRATQTTRALRFAFTPFAPLPPSVVDSVEAEARLLSDWYERERLQFEVSEFEVKEG